MTAQLRRLIYIAAVVMFAILAPRASGAEDQLIWKTKGTIQAIVSGSLKLNGFSYKLTPSTVYKKNEQQTALSAFAAGDYVEVSFISDHSVLKVEGKTSTQPVPTSTPTPSPTPAVKRFTARLTPLGTSAARGESSAGYSETSSKFTLHVRIPRNTIPLATRDVEAKALSVTATITRGGNVVATCATSFEKKRVKRSVFEFKTEIEGKGKTRGIKARSRKGRCVLANGSTGIPTVRLGDFVTVSEAQAGEFVRGTFK